MTTTLKDMIATKGFTVIGHRGFPRKFIENTLESLEAAKHEGAGMIEFDVQLTSASSEHPQGVLVLYHDATTQRLSPENKNLTVTQTSYESLEAYELTHPGDAPDILQHRGRLAALEGVFQALGTSILYYLEIKKPAHEDHNYVRSICRHTLELVRRFDLEEVVLFVSFDEEVLQTLHALDSSLYLGANCDHEEQLVYFAQQRKISLSAICPHIECLKSSYLNLLKEFSGLILPWGVKDPSDCIPLITSHIHGVTTDNPDYF